jgi:feruloyl-CoA synthase
MVDHFAPYMRDVVFAGPDRDAVAALVFPNIEACRRLTPELTPDAPVATVLDDTRVRAVFADLQRALAKANPMTSTRIARCILMAEPPSMDKGELTDKGSINQRAVLKNRAALVDELYATPLSSRVIAVEDI